jgi:hypothetical protein
MDSSFRAYLRRVLYRASQDVIASWREQVIGVLVTMAILFYQVKFGLIAQAQVSANAWALFYPYLYLLGSFVVFHLAVAPWRLDQESTQVITAAEERIDTLQGKLDECSSRLAGHVDAARKLALIKNRITDAIDAGHSLRKAGDETAVVGWANQAFVFILDAYGEAEAERFSRSDPGWVNYSSQFDGHVRLFIGDRVRRLEELLDRSNALPMEDGFEPSGWTLEGSPSGARTKFAVAPVGQRAVMMECVVADDRYAVGEQAAWPPGMAKNRLDARTWKRID